MSEFGKLLRYYRRQCHDTVQGGFLTQEMVAELLEQETNISLTAATISNWERGKSRPRPTDWELLVGLIKVLHHYNAIQTLAEANEFLASGHYRALSAMEVAEVNEAWLHNAGIPTRLAPQALAPTTFVDLPVDLPPPGPLPPGSRIPLTVNPLFVGRDDVLGALARALSTRARPTSGQTAVITGLGGVGKTQLAIEFAHRYGRYFSGGVFWFHFAEPDTIAAQIAATGREDGLNLRPDFDELPLEKQVSLVLRAWSESVPRLLIFDGCEREALLVQWRPSYGGCCVIATSRRGHWDLALGVTPVPLDVFERAHSLALLQRFNPSTSDIQANEIAAELGDLPLALHLAGSYLRYYQSDITPSTYLTQLQTWHNQQLLTHPSLQGQGAGYSPTGHELHVAHTFALSYKRLNPHSQIDGLARMLLARAACFAPAEPLPRQLLLATLRETGSAFQRTDALVRLIALGLVQEQTTDIIRLHHLVAQFIKQTIDDAAAQTDVEETVIAEAEQINTLRNPMLLRPWAAHLHYMAASAYPRVDLLTAELHSQLGMYLLKSGEYTQAFTHLTKALSFQERVSGKHHPHTAKSLYKLGKMYRHMGDLEEGCRYLEQALDIQKEKLGINHPDTARTLHDLGITYSVMGNLPEARTQLEQALAVREQVLGAGHPDTLSNYVDIGINASLAGDYATALGHLTHGLSLAQRYLQPGHPLIAACYSNIGYLYLELSDEANALRFLEQGLSINEQNLGPNHPETLRASNNLGLWLVEMGDLAEAQLRLEKTLHLYQDIVGPDHPDTADVLHNLGLLHEALGKLDKAQTYLEQAIIIRRQALGKDNPDTARSLSYLGRVCIYIGEMKKAHEYLHEALATQEHQLRKTHLDTAVTRHTLGLAHMKMGDYTRARPYLEHALATYAQVLGPDHRKTLEVTEHWQHCLAEAQN